MSHLDLTEWKQSDPVALTVAQRDALSGIVAIAPAKGEEGRYILTPGSTVGALEVDGLSILIRPKLPISRVLWLASYAMEKFELRDELFDFDIAPDLVEALAAALVEAARRAFRRGLLHGYRTEEEALHTVRGRIRIAEQIRRRFDTPLPVEVRYDDFTDDILENRLVKAAAARLGAMHIATEATRRGLRGIDATLANVALAPFAANDVPDVTFDRLNEHYRDVVTLARLVLRHATFEAERGDVRANGFLIDMNVVFQEFVTRALRQELRLSERVFRNDEGLGITLDEAEKVVLKPDLSWWEGGRCVFVGDCKYKRTDTGSVPNADLYQALAYATALDLPGALLVYAKGEDEPASHVIRHSGRRLEVVTVELEGETDDILASIARVADRARLLRREALGLAADAA